MAFEDVKTVQTTGGHNRGGPRSTAKRAELKRPSTEITPGCRVLKSGTLTPAVCRGRTAVVLMNVRTSFQNGGRRSTLQCGEGCLSPS